tara:strand:- start:732 stop:1127 length:396 start_codon:yes stop_codon:yes gene_type:complete
MNDLLGKWKLTKNIKFDSFLKFTQVPWYQRQIAAYSPIDLLLTQTSFGYSKAISSLFFNSHEEIKLDGEYRMYDKIKKKYEQSDDKIKVDIIGTIVNWNETLSYKPPILTVEYTWKEGEENKSAKQEFTKY